MKTRLFPVLSTDEQLEAFEKAGAARPIGKAMRARLRRSIERGWTIYDPGSDRLIITEAGKTASAAALRTALSEKRDAPVRVHGSRK